MANGFGAEFRRVEDRVHEGEAAVVAVAIRTYATNVEDLWEAVTTPERLARWFLPVEGDLELGGRYQLKGNAGGTITRCDPPHALDITWEFMGGRSWVSLRLAPDEGGTRLTLEHIAPRDGIGREHFERYGPGAAGVGWDLGLHGLAKHLEDPSVTIDPAAAEAWALSDEGKRCIEGSGEAWGAADVAWGTDPDVARARAAETIAFYTGS